MNGFIISILGISIFSSLISIILPSGKTGKIIKCIISLTVFLIIVTPVIKKNISLDIFNNDTDLVLQTSYLEYTKSQIKMEQEDGCRSIISDMGISNFSLSITLENSNEYKIKIVTVILNDSVIIKENANINIIETVKEKISNYLVIDKDKIVIK